MALVTPVKRSREGYPLYGPWPMSRYGPHQYKAPSYRRTKALTFPTPKNNQHNTGLITHVVGSLAGIKNDLRRKYDVTKFKTLRLIAENSYDVQGSSSSISWTVHDLTNEKGASPFNQYENVMQMYQQCIAANGDTGSSTASGGHTAANQDMFNNALRADNDFYVFQDSDNTTPQSVLPASADGFNYVRTSRWAKFYVERYTDTYRLFNSGNAVMTCKFLVVKPRKFIRKNSADGAKYPSNMDWYSFMNQNQTNCYPDAPFHNNTAAVDTTSGDQNGQRQTFAPYDTWANLVEQAEDWKNFRSFNPKKFRHVNKYYRVKVFTIVLEPGTFKTVKLILPRTTMKCLTAREGLVPNVNYRVLMFTRGEICTGTNANDFGYSAHCMTVKRVCDYSLRYGRPYDPSWHVYRLRQNVTIGGNGNIWNEETGGAVVADAAPE